MTSRRKRFLLRKQHELSLTVNTHPLHLMSGFSNSPLNVEWHKELSKVEKVIVSTFPKTELPLLIPILETDLGKKLLEARLKGI